MRKPMSLWQVMKFAQGRSVSGGDGSYLSWLPVDNLSLLLASTLPGARAIQAELGFTIVIS